MPRIEIDLNPVDFVTIGTIGPKGQRMFHLQAGKEDQLISLTIEKEQAWALSEALKDLIDDLDQKHPISTYGDISKMDMDLREPIRPMFRVSQMGIGYDEESQMIVLVAQELPQEGEESSVVRMWCSRDQMRALSLHAMDTVQSGRADPRQNGRLVYYWT
ncbi:MAG: DUF3090 family protein [Phototrophicaceae bacterium]|jgi:uncharacterized repeat protein (TIGR03847 family)